MTALIEPGRPVSRPEADRPICPECFTVRAVNGECGCAG